MWKIRIVAKEGKQAVPYIVTFAHFCAVSLRAGRTYLRVPIRSEGAGYFYFCFMKSLRARVRQVNSQEFPCPLWPQQVHLL